VTVVVGGAEGYAADEAEAGEAAADGELAALERGGGKERVFGFCGARREEGGAGLGTERGRFAGG